MPTSHRIPLLTWTLAAVIASTACVLDPESSGEIDDATSLGMTSNASFDGDGDVSGPETPPNHCNDEACTAPVEPQWSNTFSSGSHTWACDVAIDSAGRVALAWHVDVPTDAHPLGWTGILLYDSDGTLLDSVDVEGQIYGAIAFASDRTLRVRGATALGDGLFQEWVRALDPNLQPTWTQPYNQQNGWSQCGWGSRGIEVDGADQSITYEYSVMNGSGSLAVVRRHAADGMLLWTQSPGGNPGYKQAPIALGSNQSTFHGASRLYDDYGELEIRKYAADGGESWMTVVPGELDGIWGTSDGGAFASTRESFDDGARRVHRLDSSGSVTWVAGPADPSIHRVAGPTTDESGFYVVASDGLRRTSLDLATEWIAPLEHADSNEVWASAIRNDNIFALGGTGNSPTGDVFVSVMIAL
jgi:hypothetical protein